METSMALRIFSLSSKCRPHLKFHSCWQKIAHRTIMSFIIFFLLKMTFHEVLLIISNIFSVIFHQNKI